MPKFQVTAPDGKAYEITAPEGATQDQVLAYAKAHYAAGPAAAPKPAEKPSFLDKSAESFADVPREIGHQFMEATRDSYDATHAPLDPKKSQVGQVAMRGLRAGVIDPLNALSSPLTGTLTSVLGRPVESLTGGAIPKETTGNIASMAVPFLDGLNAAREASSLARSLGVTDAQARQIAARIKTTPPPPKPGAGTGRMAENVKAMDRLGVKPSTIVAAPSKDVRQAGNLLGQNLAVGHPVRAAVRRAGEGVQDATGRAAQALGEPRSPIDAGKIVKEGVERFAAGSTGDEAAARAGLGEDAAEAMESHAKLLKSSEIGFGRKANILYDRVDRMIGAPGTRVAMPQTQAALNDIRYRINDPEFIDFQVHPEVLKLNKALEDQGGQMSFDGARRLRTRVREALRADPALKHTATDAEIEKLYQAMSRDLSEGAEKLGGDAARKAFEQTDRYYRAGRQRIERALSRVFDAEAPNQVFFDLLTDAQEGKKGDLGRLMQLRRSLKPDEWRDVAASVLDSMGRALPGQRTMENASSFRTFLTNFNKLAGADEKLQREGSMADSGLKVLFDGAGHGETYRSVRDIARVASELREVDKLYNHSMSGSNLSNLAAAGAVVGGSAGLAEGHAGPAIAAFIGILGGNAASMVLENPSIARWLAGVAKEGEALSPAQAVADLKVKAAKDKSLLPLLAAVQPGHDAHPPQDDTPD